MFERITTKSFPLILIKDYKESITDGEVFMELEKATRIALYLWILSTVCQSVKSISKGLRVIEENTKGEKSGSAQQWRSVTIAGTSGEVKVVIGR